MNTGIEAIAIQVPSTGRASQLDPADVARFRHLVDSNLVPPGADYFVQAQSSPGVASELDVAFQRLGEMSEDLHAALKRPSSPLPESAPLDLHVLNAVADQQRAFMTLQISFQCAAKVLEHSTKAVQTLYKLQG